MVGLKNSAKSLCNNTKDGIEREREREQFSIGNNQYRCLDCKKIGNTEDLATNGWCTCGSKHLEAKCGGFHYTTHECSNCHKVKDIVYYGKSNKENARRVWDIHCQWCRCSSNSFNLPDKFKKGECTQCLKNDIWLDDDGVCFKCETTMFRLGIQEVIKAGNLESAKITWESEKSRRELIIREVRKQEPAVAKELEEMVQAIENDLFPEQKKGKNGLGWTWFIVIVVIVVVGGTVVLFWWKRNKKDNF